MSKEATYIRECLDMLTANLNTTYYGQILSHLSFVETDKVKEFAISENGEFLYNPSIESIQTQDRNRTIRDLLHEAGHIAFEHIARRDFLELKSDKQFTAFNIAADCTIEAAMDRDFPTLKGDPIHHEHLVQHIPREQWDTASTESLYNTLVGTIEEDAESPSAPMPQLTPAGKQALANAIQQAQSEASEAIKQAAEEDGATNTERNPNGGQGRSTDDIPDNVLNMLHLSREQLKVSSMAKLKKLFKVTFGRGEAMDDSVFNQRNLIRRELNGVAMMGRKQRSDNDKYGDVEQWHNDVVAYVDVSGSMSQDAIKRSCNLIYTLAKEYGVTPIQVHTYNTNIVQSFVIDDSTNINRLQIKTGGGTHINRAIKEKVPSNKLVLVLTDMEDDPITQWNHPNSTLVWLIHANRQAEFPQFTIGEKICINDIIRN